MKCNRILIQGAMDIEIDIIKHSMYEIESKMIHGYHFYCGKLSTDMGDEIELVLCKTGMGILHGAIASMIGIYEYHPDFILNQGTAGAHKEDIHTGDVILCESAEYLNSLRMPIKDTGQGSDSLNWMFDEKTKTRYANAELMDYFGALKNEKGNVICDAIGSGDIYSREVDRIRWMHDRKGEVCEDMETYAVYTVCANLKVPCISIRIISNNELTGEAFDPSVASRLQMMLVYLLKQKPMK